MQTGVSNARNEALLCSIDPESIETTSSSSAERESDELWRYGVEWHVNSEDYADKARFIR
jgi:hypothetical protein